MNERGTIMHCTCPPESVLVVTPWLEGGGAQKALASLMARNSETHFHVVALFSGCTNYRELRELSDVFTLLGHPRSLYGSVRASLSIGGALGNHKKVYSLLRGSHVVLGLRLRPRRRGQVLAASIHQMPSSEGSGLSARAENIMLKRLTTRADFITSPSRRAVKEAADLRYAEPARIFYEPNVVIQNAQAVRPPRSYDLETVRLLFAGRLTAQKGLDQIPHLFRDISRPVILRIVGDGPEKNSLEQQLNNFSDRVKVDFRPYTQDIVSEIDWCDAVFMPSRAELNPVFLHEAWSRGRPALVSDIGAFRDLASEGTLIIAETSEQYAQAIDRIAHDTGPRADAFQFTRSAASEFGLLDRFLGSK